MPHGHYLIYAVGSHQHHLNRSERVKLPLFSHYMGLLTVKCICGPPFFLLVLSDKTSNSDTSAPYSFKWWRDSNRCLLGPVLSFWWDKWQNSSCHRGRCLSATYGASGVSCFQLCNSLSMQLLFAFFYLLVLSTCVFLIIYKIFIPCRHPSLKLFSAV